MTDEEAIEALTDKSVVNPYLTLDALEIAIDALKERAERKTGKWHYYRCSECKCLCTYFLRGSYVIDIENRPNYCPYCGAKMEGDDGK